MYVCILYFVVIWSPDWSSIFSIGKDTQLYTVYVYIGDDSIYRLLWQLPWNILSRIYMN